MRRSCIINSFLLGVLSFLSTVTSVVSIEDAFMCQEMTTFFPNMCKYPTVAEKCPDLCSQDGNNVDEKLTCGHRMTYKRFRRIIGGTLSQPGQWPWHVSLWLNGNHTCGGSILSESLVITAAHCVDKTYTSDQPENFKVVAGTNQHTVSIQEVKVKKILKHTGYDVSLHKREDLHFVYVVNDIAILVLDGKLKLGEQNQDSVCLPDKEHAIPDSYGCYIVGYGMTKFNGTISDKLRHTQINTVPIDTCNKPESFNNTINSSTTICGGDGTEKVSPCNYDSGGGLVCDKDGTWYISGIISSGYKCGGKNAYSMYTNVAEYKPWIAEQLLKLNGTRSPIIVTTNEVNSSGRTIMLSINLFMLLLSFVYCCTL